MFVNVCGSAIILRQERWENRINPSQHHTNVVIIINSVAAFLSISPLSKMRTRRSKRRNVSVVKL